MKHTALSVGSVAEGEANKTTHSFRRNACHYSNIEIHISVFSSVPWHTLLQDCRDRKHYATLYLHTVRLASVSQVFGKKEEDDTCVDLAGPPGMWDSTAVSRAHRCLLGNGALESYRQLKTSGPQENGWPLAWNMHWARNMLFLPLSKADAVKLICRDEAARSGTFLQKDQEIMVHICVSLITESRVLKVLCVNLFPCAIAGASLICV